MDVLGITARRRRVIAAFPAARPVRSVAGMENTTERFAHRQNHPAARALGLGLGGLFALYLVGRGVAEFFTIHYSDPASYANSWGGPSLAGVFAVHSGPAVIIVAAVVAYFWRRRTHGRHTS
jgi:hypothetical protein